MSLYYVIQLPQIVGTFIKTDVVPFAYIYISNYNFMLLNVHGSLPNYWSKLI